MNQNLITILLSVITLFLSAYLAYFFGIQSSGSKEKELAKKLKHFVAGIKHQN